MPFNYFFIIGSFELLFQTLVQNITRLQMVQNVKRLHIRLTLFQNIRRLQVVQNIKRLHIRLKKITDGSKC